MKLSVGVARAIAGSTAGGMSQQQAKGLARAAVYLQAQHQQRLGKPAPATKRNGRVRYLQGPPVAGRYPFKRTGFLQANVTVESLNIQRIMREARVRVGLLETASGEALVLNLSAAVAVGGHITYRLVTV